MTEPWTISFQYWNLTFCPIRLKDSIKVDPSYRITDDSDLDRCIAMIVEEHQNVWVWCSNPKEVEKYMALHYIYIEAAGGIVSNNKNENLLIYRNEHWDLPKGKIERGETPEQGALREVEEETGMKHLKIERPLLESYHMYDLYGGWHLKKTYWFLMHTDQPDPIQPQTEEGITQCIWASADERKKHLEGSYAMMKRINSLL